MFYNIYVFSKKIIILTLLNLFILIPFYCLSNKNILILNSYSPKLSWTEKEIEGFTTNMPNNIDYIIEYMDTKRINSKEYFEHLKELYLLKFKNNKFDLIFSTDDDAFNFLLLHSKKIFGNTPIVFCGVNNFSFNKINGFDNITGVIEVYDIKETLNLTLRLHPCTKKVVVINDKTTTGILVGNQLKKIIPDFKDIQFDIFDNISLKEAQEVVSSLRKGTIILFLVFNRDKNNMFFSYEDSMKLISAYSKVPIYSTWDFYLGYGVVGGLQTSGYFQGKKATELALKIIKDNIQPKKIPIITEDMNKYMFDYNKLKEFGIKLNKLPKESIIINKPSSFYSINKKIMWIYFIFIIFLIIFAAILIYILLKLRKAMKEIEKNKILLHSILENIPNPVYVKTSKDFQYVLWNKSCEDIFGYQKNDVIGKYDQNIFPEQYSSFHTKFDKECVEKNKLIEIKDQSVLTKDNTIKLIHNKKVPIVDKYGKPEYIVGIAEDITEKMKIELELQKIHKLEAIGVLATGVAHEFNNVLTGILGNISLAKVKFSLEEKLYEIIEEAEKSCLKARELTKQLLTFSKGGTLIKKPTEIIELIKQSLTSIIKNSNIIYEFQLEDSLNKVEIDEIQIINVINNLIINAIQAMPYGGKIILKGENIFLNESNSLSLGEGNYVKISIIDQGCGIKEENLTKIFDPFFTTKEIGAGLGLSISHTIIKKHNGTITVESELKKGSTFSIYIPALT